MGGPGRRLKENSMEIKRLDWDSKFLGREVFAVTLPGVADETPDLAGMVGSLRDQGASVAYLFVTSDDPGLRRQLSDCGAVLYDERVTFSKRLIAEPQSEVAPGDEAIKVYNGEPTDELLALALLAGHESRFRKDPRLHPFFEPLYRLWMINSLKGTMADVVYVFQPDSGVKGFMTSKVGADGVGNINLMAIDDAWRGKGMGGKFIAAAEAYFMARGVETSTIVTQETNTVACGIYVRKGYAICKRVDIYHLWFN
jgi:dTDP-4-amino-4,6-dideoxy-D-galactose acyltransferase